MTNKPKLSVELRALLDRIAPEADYMLGYTSASNYDECRKAVDELRALLDEPAYPRVSIVKAHTRNCACVVGDSGVCDCGAVVDGVAVEAKPAAKHQGEPVAWVHPAYLKPGALGFEASVCRLSTLQVPLYAEQPAPVAVVMPEPYGLAMFKMLSGFESVTPEQFNLVWTACRKEVARLNGVKP